MKRPVTKSRRDRKRVEMLFAHLKLILRLGRLRLRGPRGAQFEFTMAAIAQNLRRFAKLVVRPPPPHRFAARNALERQCNCIKAATPNEAGRRQPSQKVAVGVALK
jgi:hypothetical protein